MKYEESAHQIKFVRWFKGFFPHYKFLIMSFSNGQNVGPVRGQLLVDMGLLKGAPDLLIAVPTPKYHGLFIEMKAFNGRLRPEQKEVHEQLRDQGYTVDTCFGFDEAQIAWNLYSRPLYPEAPL